MTTLDWWVIGLYLTGTLGLSAWLARRQEAAADYYLGGCTPDGVMRAVPRDTPPSQGATEGFCAP